MGRYNLAPQRIQKTVTQLIDHAEIGTIPTWYGALSDFPPTERLTRPPMQKSRVRRGGRRSRMFKPLQITYPEDALRETFFGDHPWELARPRSVAENDGKDYHGQAWSSVDIRSRRPHQKEFAFHDGEWRAMKPQQVTGESVVQRQLWLMNNANYTKVEAYDKARKEFYRVREGQEIQKRVAREEARHYGAEFGKTALDVGLDLEDKVWEDWKVWAKKEAEKVRLDQESMYTGVEADDAVLEDDAAAQYSLPPADDALTNADVLNELVRAP